jgi:hypothetical protein
VKDSVSRHAPPAFVCITATRTSPSPAEGHHRVILEAQAWVTWADDSLPAPIAGSRRDRGMPALT